MELLTLNSGTTQTLPDPIAPLTDPAAMNRATSDQAVSVGAAAAAAGSAATSAAGKVGIAGMLSKNFVLLALIGGAIYLHHKGKLRF